MPHQLINTSHIHLVKRFCLAALFAVLTAVISSSAFATGESRTWQEVSTQHAVIHFQDNADLFAFNERIQFKYPEPASDLNAEIARKIDALFVRAQELLGMKGFVNPISVKIFKDRGQLDQAYQKLYQKEGNARAWYSHDTLTIYIQLNDLHEGMLAHEFAHAIIDHYLIVPPPAESAEILARHVDQNLTKELTPSRGDKQILGYSQH